MSEFESSRESAPLVWGVLVGAAFLAVAGIGVWLAPVLHRLLGRVRRRGGR